jgi:PAS domain S-box-containing protein
VNVRFKLALAFIGIALLTAVVGYLATQTLFATAERSAMAEAEEVALVISRTISTAHDATAPGEPRSLQHLVEVLQQRSQRDVVIVDTDRQILADTIVANLGETFVEDHGGEVAATIHDGVPRIFVEQSVDYPEGIRQVVVPLQADDGANVGGVILEYTPLHNALLALAAGRIWLMVLASGGSVVLTLGIGYIVARNVTRGQAALAASEERYRTLFEESKDPVFIASRDGNLLDINQAGVDLIGYPSKESLFGVNISMHWRDADQRAHLMRSLEEHDFVRDFEVALRRSDGTELVVLETATAVRDKRGDLVAYRSILRDVTASKRAEAKLQEQAALLDLAPDAISVHEVGSRRVLFWNEGASRLYDCSSDNAVGSVLADLVDTEYPQPLEEIEAELKRHGHWEGELVQRTRDGRRVVVASHWSMRRDQHGQPAAILCISNDVTERKEEQRHQQQADKLRVVGQMASGVAHDLNQSLMLIAGYSDVARTTLEAAELDRADLRGSLDIMSSAAMAGGQTLRRLLTFARSRPEGDAELVDVRGLLDEVAQLTAPRWRDGPQAEGRPVSLAVEGVGMVVLVRRAALREALTNLVFNAVDALPTGGAIRLVTRADNGRAIIEVIDSGVGMPDDVRAHIFEPFFSTKGDRGTGLGLFQVYGIVEQNGGRTSVESAPGQGTTIRLDFAASAAAHSVQLAVEEIQASVASRRLRVLAVDDEPSMTRAVVRLLRPDGHQVVTAQSGEEALDRLTQDAFDVVVSDLGMGGGMNGWELAGQVRQRWPDVRIVLATGWGAAIDPAEARAKSVDAVLAKPYQVDDLRRVLAA